MTEKSRWRAIFLSSGAIFLAVACQSFGGPAQPVTQDQFQELLRKNDLLQQQLERQQELINSLSKQVQEMKGHTEKQDQAMTHLKDEMDSAGDKKPDSTGLFGNHKVDISGQGALAFAHSQAKGQTPNAEFRIDEAKIFVEAPIWNEVYLFAELNLASREGQDLDLHLGECYLDFENVSQLWNRDRMLNVRAGRFYIPFGEEYLSRYAIDNPLISHSVSDIWGVDEGIELYGSLGRVQYILAVQNGGEPGVRDFNADKSITARIGYDPTKWLHVSVSGMRTGDLDAKNDSLSELWFGNAWFRAFGSTNTTRFQANLVEGDAVVRLPWMVVRGTGGYVNYNDNDPTGNKNRDIYYYSAEASHDFTSKFYGAGRFSQMFAPGGIPFAGGGAIGNFFNPFYPLTTEYWRLSLGLGYRFSSNLILKGEYSLNEGRFINGATRAQENVFALQAAFKF